MGAFEKAIDYLVRILRIIGGFCLAGMMTVTCVDVVLRAFGRPIFGSVDIVQFLALIVLATAMPYTQEQRGHVGVNLLVQKLQPRTQAIVDFVTHLVALIMFAVVAREMWLYAGTLKKVGEVSMTIEIDKHPFIYFVSACFGVLCLVLVIDLIRFGRKAVRG